MSEVSIYKRYVTYVLKDGTEKKRQYDYKYHRKKPKITLHQRNILKRDIRKNILELDDGKLLTKLQNFMTTLTNLNIEDALSLLDTTEAAVKEEIEKIDDIDNGGVNDEYKASVAITC
jgi:hypothetical protein